MFAALVIISGPVRGTRFVITEDEVTIGRHSSNVFCIGDPSVSRIHCVIRSSEGSYSVADVGSNNGTYVNGELVSGSRALNDGDRIVIGDTSCQFVSSAAMWAAASDPDHDAEYASTAVLSREEAQALATAALTPLVSAGHQPDRQLRTLLTISSLLSSTSDLKGLQVRLLETIADVVPADFGAVVLLGYGQTDRPVTCEWSRNLTPDANLKISETVLRRVLRDGSALLGNGPVVDGEPNVAESLAARRIRSFICVPLLLNGILHGALYFESLQSIFDKEDLRLVTAVAGYATLALDHARRMAALEEENRYFRSQANIRHTIVGETPRIKDLLEKIRKVAQTDTTVLIMGESGTGKELVARALHDNSRRAGKPFEAINCALLRENLLESELFGYEKGAFTGAASLKRGKLEIANGGTVFLDEVGELPEAPQAMLLRVLQDHQFTRLGGTHVIKADIRIIAATNRDLEEVTKDKTFRQDLYYRLNVVSIRVPPLRERREDIPPLARHFVRLFAARNKRSVSGISPAALGVLLNYIWPGNIRQLENAIEHAVVFGSLDEIMPEDLPEDLLMSRQIATQTSFRYNEAVQEARAEIILNAIRQSGGSYSAAAEMLGIHVNNLHRLIRQLNLKSRLLTSAGSGS